MFIVGWFAKSNVWLLKQMKNFDNNNVNWWNGAKTNVNVNDYFHKKISIIIIWKNAAAPKYKRNEMFVYFKEWIILMIVKRLNLVKNWCKVIDYDWNYLPDVVFFVSCVKSGELPKKLQLKLSVFKHYTLRKEYKTVVRLANPIG